MNREEKALYLKGSKGSPYFSSPPKIRRSSTPFPPPPLPPHLSLHLPEPIYKRLRPGPTISILPTLAPHRPAFRATPSASGSMGGCASKPKAQEGPNPEALPAENPAAPEQTATPVEGDASAEAKTETVEESKEEPLADLSEPKPEESTAAAGEELAPGISELKAEAPVESAEPKEEEKVADEKVAEKVEQAIVEKAEKEENVKTEKTEAAAEHPLESSH